MQVICAKNQRLLLRKIFICKIKLRKINKLVYNVTATCQALSKQLAFYPFTLPELEPTACSSEHWHTGTGHDNTIQIHYQQKHELNIYYALLKVLFANGHINKQRHLNNFLALPKLNNDFSPHC